MFFLVLISSGQLMRKLNIWQGESFTGQIDKLKGVVRMMFNEVVDPLERLELIDILQRLGISYHFDDEIQKTLKGIYNANNGGEMCNKENIYATALEFRLLRQHGYSVPQGKQLIIVIHSWGGLIFNHGNNITHHF
jgi:hypothetical protein